MRTSALAIDVSGLAKSFGTLKVLQGVDCSVAGGSIFALLGSNGAGKTTVVRILSTLLKPDAGAAQVAGFDVVSPTPASGCSTACRAASSSASTPCRSPAHPSCGDMY